MKFLFIFSLLNLYSNIYAIDLKENFEIECVNSHQIYCTENSVFTHFDGKFQRIQNAYPIKVERLYSGSLEGLPEVESLSSVEVEGFFSEKFGLIIKNPIDKKPTGKLVKYPTGKRDWICPKCNGLNDKAAKMCDHCLWDSEKDPLWVQETD